MTTIEITTTNLKLVLNKREKVLAQIDAMSSSDRAQVSPVWLSAAMAAAAPDPWIHGFTTLDREIGATIGNAQEERLQIRRRSHRSRRRLGLAMGGEVGQVM
jgi:hypothetical protein